MKDQETIGGGDSEFDQDHDDAIESPSIGELDKKFRSLDVNLGRRKPPLDSTVDASTKDEVEELTLNVIREPGCGLGMSIAGGIGSTAYVGDDLVRCPRFPLIPQWPFLGLQKVSKFWV